MLFKITIIPNTFIGSKGEAGRVISLPGPQGAPGARGETGRPGLQGKFRLYKCFILLSA